MRTPLQQTWDLDTFFPGGSASPAFASFLNQLEADLSAFRSDLAAAQPPQDKGQLEPLAGLLERMQDLSQRLRHAESFVGCLTAQNVKDEGARLLTVRVKQLQAAFESALTTLDTLLVAVPSEPWQALVADPRFALAAYPLEERRRRARERMEPLREQLASDLAVDGYHAWSELYDTLVGRVTIPFREGEREVLLSAGQAHNRLRSSDRKVRSELFAAWEEAWAKDAELFATALNHLAGFRLNLYRHRGWDSVLKEPLEVNRMKPETLQVMWDVVERNKAPLVAYLNRKAKLMGLDRLAWYDVEAPLGGSERTFTYEEAAEFVVEHFRRFSPAMGDFAAHAFTHRWIEAEDRPGKQAGGFCTSFPLKRQSRIFMTFSGTANNVSTLAHELGHAYHQSLMEDLPELAQDYAMNVAETASTFAETLVSDAALQEARTQSERVALLAEKIERGIAFFMNIHSRFLFETAFYAERAKGAVSVQRLNQLMEEAQRRAFCDALSQYHPYFWASKLHFYITEQPFYNFPYTFGYLFSLGIYARAKAEGPAFADRYAALLRDTGRMPVEELAARHLGVDLTRPDFWQSAADVLIADVQEFLRLTE
ncbi:MAG TPA: M3 family oligoendopeptidase [Symbiobacteriaceae bacterium]